MNELMVLRTENEKLNKEVGELHSHILIAGLGGLCTVKYRLKPIGFVRLSL